jgi:hypothetical protein
MGCGVLDRYVEARDLIWDAKYLNRRKTDGTKLGNGRAMLTRGSAALTQRFDDAFSAHPEIEAMSSITNILTALPDESARMRVMRWAFGRFSGDFKRPDTDVARAVPPPPAPAVFAPAGPERPAPLAFAPKPQPAPAAFAAMPTRRVPLAKAQPFTDDFAEQLAELEELLPPRREDPFPEL